MGNYLSTCNGIKSIQIIKSTRNDLPSNSKPIIRLILIGLDNSGKTSTALHLLKKPLDDVIPTLGFNSYTLDSPALNKNKGTKVELIDLGGSEKIRKLWEDYFPSAHGLICLLDSADTTRFKELKSELEKILSNKNVQGKPLLVLLNKMDLDEAMDEVEICNAINIEHLVNENKCPTKIEQCAVKNKNPASVNLKKKKVNLDSGIEQGFTWIVNYVLNNWEKLNERVSAELEREEQANKEKMEALREKYNRKKSGDANEEANVSEQVKKEDPFKPIEEVVKEIEKKEQTNKNGLKDGIVKKNVSRKTDSTKETKLKSKLTEKINEVKKKAAVVRQNKVADKVLEKQNSKSDIKADPKEENKDTKEKEIKAKEVEEKEIKEKEIKEEKSNDQMTSSIDEKLNETSQTSTATNSIDTVIEVKK